MKRTYNLPYPVKRLPDFAEEWARKGFLALAPDGRYLLVETEVFDVIEVVTRHYSGVGAACFVHLGNVARPGAFACGLHTGGVEWGGVLHWGADGEPVCYYP